MRAGWKVGIVLGGGLLFLWRMDYFTLQQEMKEAHQEVRQILQHEELTRLAMQVAAAFSACRQAQSIPADKPLTQEAIIAVACHDADMALSRWQVVGEELSVSADD